MLEKRNKDNFTPLLIAAFKGHEKTVKCLMQRRAEVFAMDKNEKTAIYWAAAEDKLAALKVCLWSHFETLKSLKFAKTTEIVLKSLRIGQTKNKSN
jgi:ankyrin repeat protein